jgi:hypothetical protein
MALAELVVVAGSHERMACPVACQVEAPAGAAPSELRLVDRASGVPVPLQVRTGESGALALAWVVDAMAPFTRRVYDLVSNVPSQTNEIVFVRLLAARVESTSHGVLK